MSMVSVSLPYEIGEKVWYVSDNSIRYGEISEVYLNSRYNIGYRIGNKAGMIDCESVFSDIHKAAEKLMETNK